MLQEITVRDALSDEITVWLFATICPCCPRQHATHARVFREIVRCAVNSSCAIVHIDITTLEMGFSASTFIHIEWIEQVIKEGRWALLRLLIENLVSTLVDKIDDIAAWDLLRITKKDLLQ